MKEQLELKINQTVYHHLKGVICLVGYGACGQGLVPLLKRHLTYDRFVIVDPYQIPPEGTCDNFYHLGLTQENFSSVLGEIFSKQKGFCVNLSCGVSSNQVMEFCQQIGVLYIDACNEEFMDFYTSENYQLGLTNYGVRYLMNENVVSKKYKTTAVSCCGANPGMVNWFLKKALIDIAYQTGFKLKEQPKTRQEWAKLMRDLGVKGVQIAERDTQYTNLKRPIGHFWNTWSVQGLIDEAYIQLAQIGWGTHQKWFPSNGNQFSFGPKSSIYLNNPGMCTQVRSWCPTSGPHLGYLITHDQTNSIAEYYQVKQNDQTVFRPTTMYAYHPCDEAILSINDLVGSNQVPKSQNWLVMKQEIVAGCDELGVLVYGHGKNAYWYGSNLNIDRARKMAPNQNATILQVTSAMLAGIVWAIENPQAGVVDTNHMDYKRCLQIQSQYIQQVKGVFTDWTPIKYSNDIYYKENIDKSDPWQFKNIIIHK